PDHDHLVSFPTRRSSDLTNYHDTADWYSSRRVRLRHSGFKVLVEEDSGRILGAHLLGAHAEEVINLFALAIRTGLRSSDLKHMVDRKSTRLNSSHQIISY